MGERVCETGAMARVLKRSNNTPLHSHAHTHTHPHTHTAHAVNFVDSNVGTGGKALLLRLRIDHHEQLAGERTSDMMLGLAD